MTVGLKRPRSHKSKSISPRTRLSKILNPSLQKFHCNKYTILQNSYKAAKKPRNTSTKWKPKLNKLIQWSSASVKMVCSRCTYRVTTLFRLLHKVKGPLGCDCELSYYWFYCFCIVAIILSEQRERIMKKLVRRDIASHTLRS